MGTLKKIELPNGAVVYMQAADVAGEAAAALSSTLRPPGNAVGTCRGEGGLSAKGDSLIDTATEKAEALTEVIKGIAAMIPTAFRHANGAEVEKVTLSFGLKAGGKAGIPLVTEGSAEGSIGVVLECCYPRTTPAGTTSGN